MKEQTEKTQKWLEVIKPKGPLFEIRFKEIWYYRDLLLLFVWRDFVAVYKQTILGPLWYIVQPLLTTFIFTVVFARLAGLPTDGLPPMLFYLAGIVAWNYFADCLRKTSTTFISNSAIFGKVYFPRLIVPLSIVVSNLISFSIQLLFFIAFWIYFYFKGIPISFSYSLLIVPYLIFLMGLLGLGLGIIVSALTTKYRDLSYLVLFGIQLFMYITPVIYSVGSLPVKFQSLIMLNPMSAIIEAFRYAFLGVGLFSYHQLLISSLTIFVLFFFGLVLFNRVERTFMDTV